MRCLNTTLAIFLLLSVVAAQAALCPNPDRVYVVCSKPAQNVVNCEGGVKGTYQYNCLIQDQRGYLPLLGTLHGKQFDYALWIKRTQNRGKIICSYQLNNSDIANCGLGMESPPKPKGKNWKDIVTGGSPGLACKGNDCQFHK